MSRLDKKFVEERIVPLKHIPSVWHLESVGNYYVLDLRMCFLQRIYFDFEWGDDSAAEVHVMPITDQPSRILKIDMSLNDLDSLDSQCFIPFRAVRSLNASVNRLQKCSGVAALPSLTQLDLSYNFLDDLNDLNFCKKLVELYANHNNLSSLRSLPLLPHLVYLNVDGNKLESLDGVQALTGLQELSARRNRIRYITALGSSRHLTALDLSSNQISDMEQVVSTLPPLPKLKNISLMDNPIAQLAAYTHTMKALFKLHSLDGIPIQPDAQPPPPLKKDDTPPRSDIEMFRQVAKKAYYDRIRESKLSMEESVRHLQKRIISLQDDHKLLEKKLMNEMDATLNHIDFLDRQTLENFRASQRLPPEYHYLPERRECHHPSKMKRSERREPDDVLRLAAMKLTKEQRDDKHGAVPPDHHRTPFD